MSKDEVKPRVLVKCASSFLAASLAVAGLATTGITAQAKDNVEKSAVASLRSFPKASVVKRNLLSESVSTEVDNNHSWGGIPSLRMKSRPSWVFIPTLRYSPLSFTWLHPVFVA